MERMVLDSPRQRDDVEMNPTGIQDSTSEENAEDEAYFEPRMQTYESNSGKKIVI